MTPSLPLAMLAPALGSAVARRCAPYRATSRGLWVLAGLSAARLLAGALRGAAVPPYTGGGLAAWATREAAGLAWGWCAAAMVWGVLAAPQKQTPDRVGIPAERLLSRSWLRWCPGPNLPNGPTSRLAICATLACLALLSTLILAYPHLRGARITAIALWSARAAALAQVAAGVAWLGRRKSEAPGNAPPFAKASQKSMSHVRAIVKGISLAERVALLFATGAAWDLCGTLAPWADMLADWGVLTVGNAVFWAAICGVQAREIWRLYGKDAVA